MRYAILTAVACTLVASSAAEDPEPADTPLTREVEAINTGLRSRQSKEKQEAAKKARKLGIRLTSLMSTLGDALEDPDEAVRFAAIDALYEMGPAAYIETWRIVKRLKDDSKRVRARAADACCHIGPLARQAVPDLIKALDDKDEHVRNRAIAALANIGAASKPAIPRLKKFIPSEDKKLAEAARIGIIRIEKDKW